MKIEKKKETIRIVKFFLFSVSAGVIEMITFALLNELTEWTYWPCYLIALTISVLWNFTLNRNFTFQSASNVPVAMIKVAIFYCIFTPVTALLGNYLAEDLRWNEYLVTAINMALNLTTEYLYDRYFVFGKTIDTNNRAELTHNNQKKGTRK
jgi:putative flippase GtrA